MAAVWVIFGRITEHDCLTRRTLLISWQFLCHCFLLNWFPFLSICLTSAFCKCNVSVLLNQMSIPSKLLWWFCNQSPTPLTTGCQMWTPAIVSSSRREGAALRVLQATWQPRHITWGETKVLRFEPLGCFPPWMSKGTCHQPQKLPTGRMTLDELGCLQGSRIQFKGCRSNLMLVCGLTGLTLRSGY